MKVLDGSGARLSFQVGANIGDTIDMRIEQGMRADQVGHVAGGAVDLSSFVSAGKQVESQASPGDWATDGKGLGTKSYFGVDVDWSGFLGSTVREAGTFLRDQLGDGFKVTVKNEGLQIEKIDDRRLELKEGDLSFTNADGEQVKVVGSFRSVQQVADVLNAGSKAGLSAYVAEDGTLHFNARSALTVSGAEATKLGFAANYDLDMSASLAEGSVLTRDDAQALIARIDSTLDTVSATRSKLGAVQNRLESTIRNLDNIRGNLTESRTAIREADMAEESAEKTMAMILQQSGMSVLAQANASQQLVLKLLE
jgi:flagellin